MKERGELLQNKIERLVWLCQDTMGQREQPPAHLSTARL